MVVTFCALPCSTCHVPLAAVYHRFPTRESCLGHLELIRWPNGPRCPYCGSLQATALPRERRFHCNPCNTSFSVTVGTVFHRSRADLQKWFYAVALLMHQGRGLTCREMGRELQVNRNTAHLMSSRIRFARGADREMMHRMEVNFE